MVPNEIPPQYLLSASAPESRTLIDILRATVDAYPEVPAIDDGDVVLTYSELWEEVLEGADFLGRSNRLPVARQVGSDLVDGAVRFAAHCSPFLSGSSQAYADSSRLRQRLPRVRC